MKKNGFLMKFRKLNYVLQKTKFKEWIKYNIWILKLRFLNNKNM